MKQSINILIFILLILTQSCIDSIDNEYKNLSSEIDYYKLNSQYKTPLINYFIRLDSLTTELINDNEQIDLRTFRLFKSIVITNSIDDSTKKIIKNNLDFDFDKINKNELIGKIKTIRNIYLRSLVDYLKQIENDNSFNQIIKHTYLSSINDTDYLNLDIFIPTAKESSIAVILKSNCQWANLDMRGLSLRTADKPGIDTISVEIKWFDYKLNDTIDKNLIIFKK
ncbi:MAG: hypothetical protein ACFFG0_37490 [Candidatus Thorarchaeota archaeon]